MSTVTRGFLYTAFGAEYVAEARVSARSVKAEDATAKICIVTDQAMEPDAEFDIVMPITEAGGGLSGGQRQLLSIARMMLRNPQLVFMDEPTSNMDQNTEARVIAVIKDWLRGRTLLMCTHRPQLLEWVDAIAVIDSGQCVAFGPKQEMIDKLSRGIDVNGGKRQEVTP